MRYLTVHPSDWQTYPSRAYADWFSQLEGMRSPVAIGTRSADGVDNLAVFNSMTHVGARPPLLGVVFRPLTVERHTYDNLKATGYFTVNYLPALHVDALHQTSAKYERGVSEFDAVGLTPLPSSHGTPYVAEAVVSLELRFVEEHQIAANDCVFVVGAVEEMRLREDFAFGPDSLDWGSKGGMVVSGLYNYYRVSKLVEKAYAKTS